jgi:predicted RNase H-like HicB family nuclease
MDASLRYLVVVELVDDGTYSSWAPDLPGCVATGETRQECEENMCDAIALHMAGLRDDGTPIPRPTAVASATVEVDVD